MKPSLILFSVLGLLLPANVLAIPIPGSTLGSAANPAVQEPTLVKRGIKLWWKEQKLKFSTWRKQRYERKAERAAYRNSINQQELDKQLVKDGYGELQSIPGQDGFPVDRPDQMIGGVPPLPLPIDGPIPVDDISDGDGKDPGYDSSNGLSDIDNGPGYDSDSSLPVASLGTSPSYGLDKSLPIIPGPIGGPIGGPSSYNSNNMAAGLSPGIGAHDLSLGNLQRNKNGIGFCVPRHSILPIGGPGSPGYNS
ncbi:hypothetical protein BASA50_000311 [Batrachochytrium salamandrivorans]|uniref:BZIP domain-containing protein n=1 Tax=Batrachochytrium salamandrivorans TaxID=1357716 RepID=A0ABQ8EU82_9FUNG|nr:hypothetical protein BASA62_009669 [Batrachochytrium salamandrivorans]KAH6574679.1 hypothetical protein BASA60_005381 [Batrachochytrium salamandrivorans]KAH6586714.1 hypothetical protein BASA50_000311 [Batrachochytrium salamandrivorans]KAH6599220.1 hypothetical protein BASA61_002637 [Batrachochytrium salamandrivorans]KAJ1341893.1 hypothetical protein BSLG_003546 [Batrachochytrium salamandrivorans]